MELERKHEHASEESEDVNFFLRATAKVADWLIWCIRRFCFYNNLDLSTCIRLVPVQFRFFRWLIASEECRYYCRYCPRHGNLKKQTNWKHCFKRKEKISLKNSPGHQTNKIREVGRHFKVMKWEQPEGVGKTDSYGYELGVTTDYLNFHCCANPIFIPYCVYK